MLGLGDVTGGMVPDAAKSGRYIPWKINITAQRAAPKACAAWCVAFRGWRVVAMVKERAHEGNNY